MTDWLDDKILTTVGGSSRILYNLFEQEGGPSVLSQIINGERVLLLGAGIPRAALELYTHLGTDNPTSIVSLDARYGTDLHYMNKQVEDEMLRYAPEVQKRVRDKLVARNWNDPNFTDGLGPFDYILANGSYLFYDNTYTKQSMQLLLKILSPGGEFRAQALLSLGITPQLKLAYEFVNSIDGYTAEIRQNKEAYWIDQQANRMMPEYLYFYVKRKAEA